LIAAPSPARKVIQRNISIPMSPSRLKILRLLFWACWAGTIMFFVVTPFDEVIGYDFGRFGYPFVTLLTTGLCFTSAVFVRHNPQLALTGILTLICPFLILLVFALIELLIVSLMYR
jgi:hypothetical protein